MKGDEQRREGKESTGMREKNLSSVRKKTTISWDIVV